MTTTLAAPIESSGARLSPCGKYRYSRYPRHPLYVKADVEPVVLWRAGR